MPGSIKNSVQIKFSLTFLVLIAALLVMLNIYPTIVSRDLVFSSKQASLQSQATVMSSALATPDELNSETVAEVISLLDLHSLTRLMVTDENALILYDSNEYDPSAGRYALLPEVSRALSGEAVCYSTYNGQAFRTCESVPIVRSGIIVGAVYLYEYDSDQARLISEIQSELRNISLVLALVAVILILIFSRALTIRITELAKATRIVSEGDYDHKITVKGDDELSELGREFNDLTQRLKETEEQRRRFVSDASHELKTPLASIRLLSDSIVNSDNMDEGTMRDFVTDIGNEAERLQRTTEKLLCLSRIGSEADIEFEMLDLRSVVEKTLHLLSPLAKDNGVAISTDLRSGCMINGNEDLVYRIIFNLVENAIKYNVPNGKVKIKLRRKDEYVELTVSDTGIGIPEEDLPHIFSRFYRVDKARSREAGGSGLGLSIVYDAVILHNGSITVESRKDQGTRFTVTFPAYTAQEELE